ncbi:MAG: NTP/NDP exchange transporter [Candidatus Dependentiae bacterium]
MSSRFGKFFRSLFSIEKHERVKVFSLTISFFLIIAAYTIARELKDSIFVAIVGKSYLPIAKILTLVILIPPILFYSFLVDKIRRYQLLCYYSMFFGAMGLLFAFLLGHPTIGIANTATSPFRFFGWIFYFFVEGYSPFLVSVFWAFANSINDPAEAKNNYGIMVSGSKLGGIISAIIAWATLKECRPFCYLVTSDIAKHQVLLGFSSILLLVVPLVIMRMIRSVSGKYLHGYEAAYRVEKQRAKEGESGTGIFSGLHMFVKHPYLLGIFCMVFFYEIINSVLGYLKIGFAQSNSESLSDVSGYLFLVILATHITGFAISFFGTKALLNKLGERLCLVLIPAATGLLLLYLMISYTQFALIVVYVVMRGINYGFSYPVRESLYIPTVKEIKFKSKSWIDAFGSKFAKSTGSVFNYVVDLAAPLLLIPLYSGFFALIIGVWIFAAILLGRRFDKAVANNEVIGIDR